MSTNKKTLSELKAEKEYAEKRLMQEIHKLERLDNRQSNYEKGQRAKRTHRLCNIGGAVESIMPEIKELSKSEIYFLMEEIFSLDLVKTTVQNVVESHNLK